MKIDVEVLNNGATLVTAPLPGVETASVFYFFKAGARNETDANNGIAHFTEHMMFKGTAKRPTAVEIAHELDNIGSQSNAFTDKEVTAYYAKAAGEFVPEALDVLSDMVLDSKFDEKEIDKERGAIIEEIRMYRDIPAAHVGELYERIIYEGSSAARPILGPEKNISSFDRQTFLDFYGQNYGAENVIMVLAGNIQKGVDKAKGYLEKMHHNGGGKNPYYLPSVQGEPRISLESRDINQGQFQFGVPGYGYTHPDRLAFKVLSIILGGNMSSRLFMEVREKRGLVYTINTSTESISNIGQLTTAAGVETEKIYDAVQITLEEYQKIADTLTEQELERAKNFYKGNLAISLEDTSRIATFLASQIYYQDRAEEPEEILKRIGAITSEDVQRVARDLFRKEKLNLAVVGPYQSEEKFAKILGI